MDLRVVGVCARSSSGAALSCRAHKVFWAERGKITLQACIGKRGAPRRGVNVRTNEQTTSFLVQCTTFTFIHVRSNQARQLEEWSRVAEQGRHYDEIELTSGVCLHCNGGDEGRSRARRSHAPAFHHHYHYHHVVDELRDRRECEQMPRVDERR